MTTQVMNAEVRATHDSAPIDRRLLASLLDAIRACRTETYALWDHSIRVASTARRLAVAVGLAPETRRLAYLGGLLHVVGKTATCTRALFKPGPLTAEERRVMNLHPELGERLVRGLELDEVTAAVHLHHELCDGTGYPFGLRGREIPEVARLVSVADYYEALCESRPYRPVACSRGEALALVGSLAADGKLDAAICRNLPPASRPGTADASKDFERAARFFELPTRSSTGR
jgi:HD-GYP domain-containing protein (c-di-GMP phosphodiesterase class II)